MRIPRSFKVMGLTYTVELKTKADWKDDDCWAHVDFNTRKVSILKRDKDADLQSFLHEVVHVVFTTLGRTKLTHDEALVDTCASVLHQILSSAK